MILVDANLLLYASSDVFPHHEVSKRWLDDVLSSPGRVGLPWGSLLAFVRIASNPRVLARPTSVERAWQHVRLWLSAPGVWVPQATEAHEAVMTELIVGRGLTSKLVMDADLAALALEHGLTLFSADSDFRRFARLRFINPLIADS